MRLSPLLGLIAIVVSAPQSGFGQSSRENSPALTIYNQDFAVIREVIPLGLKQGTSSVHFDGVTAQLEPQSVMLRHCGGRGKLTILEQNYRAPISQHRMLADFQGQTIDFLVRRGDTAQIVQGRIIRPGTFYDPLLIRRYGQEFYPAQYYNAQPSPEESGLEQPLIEVNSRLEFALPGTPLFPTSADPSAFHPEVSWIIESDQSGDTTCELSYVSGGMTWTADYNVIAPAKGQDLDLIGWVTLDNHSGKSFENASIKLMAGDVHKVQPGMPMGGVVGGLAGGLDRVAAGVPQVTEKAFDEYHLYSLERPATLRNSETKQVEFLRRTGVPSKRVYVYHGFLLDPAAYGGYQPEYLRDQRWFGTTSNPRVWVMQEITNTDANNLGMPLPRGRMRFYRQDDSGQLEFVGENTVDHTPRGETLRVYTGNAFDITGDRRRTSFRVDNMREFADESFEIKVRNHKKEPVDVVVVENLYRGVSWQITSNSVDFVKRDSQTIEFPAHVLADGEQTIIYSVHYSW